MHMPDALISPAVAVPGLVAAGAALAFACRKAAREVDNRRVPLMGVLGAFVFAAQMINLPVVVLPGVSWHLVGAVLMVVLLGPYSSFIVMAAVLTMQALLLGDGGLLALGCNVLNMGIVSCFLAYGVYATAVSWADTPRGRAVAVVLAAVASSSAAALAAAAEIHLSGKNPVTFASAAWLMGSIHFVFGFGEAALTVAALALIRKARPAAAEAQSESERKMMRRFAIGGLAVSLVIGGIVSWWASSSPDGLEHTAGVLKWPEGGNAFAGLLAPVQKVLGSEPFVANAIVGLTTTALAFAVAMTISAAISRSKARANCDAADPPEAA